MRVPDGVLDPELANSPEVLTRKAGLSAWHARVLRALERIADYYDTVPAIKGTGSRRAGGSDA